MIGENSLNIWVKLFDRQTTVIAYSQRPGIKGLAIVPRCGTLKK